MSTNKKETEHTNWKTTSMIGKQLQKENLL